MRTALHQGLLTKIGLSLARAARKARKPPFNVGFQTRYEIKRVARITAADGAKPVFYERWDVIDVED